MTMSISFEILIVLLIIVLGLFIRHYLRRKKDPPGPLGLPFVGQIPIQIIQIIFSRFLPERSMEKDFKQLKDKYGSIWSMDLGVRKMVGLGSVDVLSEAFSDNAKLFSGRSFHESFRIISEDRGIIWISGELAKGNRQLALKALRDLGMGKPLLIGKISNEADELIDYIERNSAKPIVSPELFAKSVTNVISLLSFDERYTYDDPEIGSFITNLTKVMHSNDAHETLEFFETILDKKYLRKIFPSVDKYIKSNEECMRVMSNRCRARIKIEHEFSKPNCVFDYFWRYRFQDYPNMSDDEKVLDISHSMFDIFFGGSDTTTNVLAFSCLLLGEHQELQKELRSEIQLQVDDYKLIKNEMRNDCPKLLSFIDEIQRYCYLIPLIHRRVIEPCTFRGYELTPKDIIYGDLATIMRDPLKFENPDDFIPHRFMDETRTKYVSSKALIPFGMGKRVCLGEGIAVIELFLFLSKIILRFHISLPNETKIRLPKILEGNAGIVHAPLEHEINFEVINS